MTKRARHEILELVIKVGAHLGGGVSRERQRRAAAFRPACASPPILYLGTHPALPYPSLTHLLLHISLLRLSKRVVLHGGAISQLVVHR